MAVAGGPDAVAEGAARLGVAAGTFHQGAEGVRVVGSGLAATWSGDAAASAREALGRVAAAAAVPGEVAAAARPVLEGYAQALREAQQRFALGGEMIEQGVRGQLAETAGPASRGRDEATGRGAAGAAQGEVVQAGAVEEQLRANRAAAARIDELTAQLTAVSGPVPPTPPTPVEKDEGVSFSTIGHALLDLGGLVPFFGEPLDLANAAWYGAEGDYLSASLAAGAAIPIAGWVFTGGKIANKGVKLVDSMQDARVWMRGRPPMVPANAERVPFKKTDKFPAGDSFQWPSTRTPGKTTQYRAHGLDPRVEPPNNAGVGPVYRVKDGKDTLGSDGTWYKENAFSKTSPHYAPNAVNDTHIPYPKDLSPPGAMRAGLPNPTSLGDDVAGEKDEK